MPGNARPILSGSSMAVLIGAGALLSAFLAPRITLGNRLILFFIGLVILWAGLRSSKG